MDLISKLYDFVENGGRLEAGKEPVYGEPFYPEYMCQLVKSTYEIGDRVQVESENGKKLLIPKVDQFVLDIDAEKREITVRLIEGMLDL